MSCHRSNNIQKEGMPQIWRFENNTTRDCLSQRTEVLTYHDRPTSTSDPCVFSGIFSNHKACIRRLFKCNFPRKNVLSMMSAKYYNVSLIISSFKLNRNSEIQKSWFKLKMIIFYRNSISEGYNSFCCNFALVQFYLVHVSDSKIRTCMW